MSEVTPNTQIGSDGVRYPAGTQPTVDPGFYGQGFDLSNPDDNDVLTYNSATGKWEPSPSAGGGGGGAGDLLAANNLDDVDDATTARTNLGAGTMSNVVEDTTPQLGGELDAQGNIIVNVGSIRYDVNTVAASGATETLILGVNNVTMDENCEFTFPAGTSGDYDELIVRLSGAFTPTWPVSVDWFGGTEPTYVSPTEYSFATYDGGTTWLGVASVYDANPGYDIEVFTANGTFTKADYPWAKAIRVRMVGGGGGSGGCAATGAGEVSLGGPGGGGAYAESRLAITAVGTTETVTVGAGGTAGASNANGGGGGATSFGTLVTAAGGQFGTAGAASIPANVVGGTPGAGGSTATADFSTKGQQGTYGFANATNRLYPGYGGGNVLSAQHGRTTVGASAGGVSPPADAYGVGAFGPSSVPSTSAQGGAAGSAGVVIVEIYG